MYFQIHTHIYERALKTIMIQIHLDEYGSEAWNSYESWFMAHVVHAGPFLKSVFSAFAGRPESPALSDRLVLPQIRTTGKSSVVLNVLVVESAR